MALIWGSGVMLFYIDSIDTIKYFGPSHHVVKVCLIDQCVVDCYACDV